jgi:5-methylcytosine-specific restriction endonuclease McrA
MQLSTCEIVDKILLKFNIPFNEFVRKPRAGHPGWTNKQFIELIVIHGTGPAIVKAEHCGEQTVNRALTTLVSPITGKLHGGNETFRNKLFSLVEIKKCPGCVSIKYYDDFGIDNNDPYGRTNYCKECMSIRNKTFYNNNKDKYHKPYIEEHRSEYNARNAKRRSDKLLATPSWANLDLIKEIYANAEGMHVDHIIPLISDYVCGLHVENNLQYLTPEENSKKSNKLLEEFTSNNYS